MLEGHTSKLGLMNRNGHSNGQPGKLLAYLTGAHSTAMAAGRPLIGVLEGTGIGPHVIGAALQVLAAVEQAMGLGVRCAAWRQDRRRIRGSAEPLAAGRCGGILRGNFSAGRRGAQRIGRRALRVRPAPALRFVLQIRSRPAVAELARAGRIAPQHLQGVDILIVRDNTGGVYQGEWGEHATDQGRVAEHSFRYTEAEIHRLVRSRCARCPWPPRQSARDRQRRWRPHRQRVVARSRRRRRHGNRASKRRS